MQAGTTQTCQYSGSLRVWSEVSRRTRRTFPIWEIFRGRVAEEPKSASVSKRDDLGQAGKGRSFAVRNRRPTTLLQHQPAIPSLEGRAFPPARNSRNRTDADVCPASGGGHRTGLSLRLVCQGCSLPDYLGGKKQKIGSVHGILYFAPDWKPYFFEPRGFHKREVPDSLTRAFKSTLEPVFKQHRR